MNEATAAEPPPDPARQLREALRHAAAAVDGGTREVRDVIAAGMEPLELMNWSHRLAEACADIRAASMALVASGQPAPAPEAQAPRRHRHRAASPRAGRALRAVPGVPSAAVRVAAASIVVLGGGVAAGMHEEASSVTYAAAPAGHAVLHRMAPDGAVSVPHTRPSWSPRPSVAAASARPAPVVTPSPASVPSTPAPPPPPPSPAAVPALSVPRLLDLGGSILGQLPLTVTAGSQSVEWTATATDGIRLSSYSGVAVAGQDVVIQVTDGPARGGWVYISFGGTTAAVQVTSDLDVPALALPS